MNRIFKTIYKIDSWYFSVNGGECYGDLAFTFCDSDETRSESYEETRENALYGLGEAIKAGDVVFNGPEEIAIYRVLQATAYLDLQDDEDSQDYANDNGIYWSVDRWDTVLEIPACTAEYAKAVGLTNELEGAVEYYNE